MRLLQVFLCTVCLVTPGVSALDGTNELKQLVEKLGAGSYAERQTTANAIIKTGDTAVPYLEAVTNSNDPEVRMVAVDLLNQIKSGVTAEWPADIADRALKIQDNSQGDRLRFYGRVKKAVGVKSVSYLMKRGAIETDEGRKYLLELLCTNDVPEMAESIAGSVADPDTRWMAQVLAWAYRNTKKESMAVKVLAKQKCMDAEARMWLDDKLDSLCREVESGKLLSAVIADAKYCISIVPDDGRFYYVTAAALAKSGEKKEADEVIDKTLSLYPDKEQPHYDTANFLLGRKWYDMAQSEFLKVLDLPETDSILDVNAYLRLGDIAKSKKEYQDAVEYYESAMTLDRKRAQDGSGAILKGYDRNMEEVIGVLKKECVDDQVICEISIRLKPDGNRKAEDVAAEYAKADITIKMNIQPEGVRFSDLPKTSFRYDNEKSCIEAVMNGAVLDRFEAVLQKKVMMAALIRDEIAFCEIDNDTGGSQMKDTVRLDYELSVKADSNITVNLKPFRVDKTEYDGKNIQKAPLSLDILPKELSFSLDCSSGGSDPADKALSDALISINGKAIDILLKTGSVVFEVKKAGGREQGKVHVRIRK